MPVVTDKSGIYSLGGFAYQIKVFVCYALILEEDMQAGFETLEDVTIRKLVPENIDENEDKFRSLFVSPSGISAIQVKRTAVDKSTAKQILLNWILLEGTKSDIVEYVLFTDQSYNNGDIIFNITVDELFAEVVATKLTTKSTIGKVKKIFKKNKEAFIEVYNKIRSKYKFIASVDIDREINDRCRLLFKRGGINPVVYQKRIDALLQHITFEIMKQINMKKSYLLSYNEMIACTEDICNRYTDTYIYPVYSEFKKLNKVDFKDLHLVNSREYKQLVACELPEKIIEMHMHYRDYYQNIRFGYIDTGKIERIRDIEETTFENYETVKFTLQKAGQDKPFRRLEETKSRPNSHAASDQIRYGSGIYLTRSEEEENQISWEDEDNVQS